MLRLSRNYTKFSKRLLYNASLSKSVLRYNNHLSTIGLNYSLRDQYFNGFSTSSSSAATDTATAEETVTSTIVNENVEKATGTAEEHAFKAETRQILDIVANSLYTDREVFIRELISNASDALEKVRYLSSSSDNNIFEPERSLEIRITANEDDNTLIFQDFGIGMNADELVANLGTIANSGSKKFVQNLKDQGQSSDNVDNIIGQFGVGFYSSLMVADRVEVYSRSAVLGLKDKNNDEAQKGYYWSTDGSGSYELSEADNCVRGTKIIIHLKENAKEFAQKSTIENIIRKYSNFVGCPIFLNNEKINTIDAIWTKNNTEVTDQEHLNFYQYIANAYDTPPFRLHFQTDAPISINALFYFPERHLEKLGMGRLDAGVSLYSRKILIQSKSSNILPDWCRFVKGVVDCEDIPLNISRENMQDSALIARLKTVLTKKIIKFLNDQGNKSPDEYNKWFLEFGQFIKEGICTDFVNKNDIAKLLRYDTSLPPKESDQDLPPSVSLDEYISRMPPHQKNIYFLSAPSRKYALESPYYESFKSKNIEVIFLYQAIDDFVMKNLDTYNNRKLVSIESSTSLNEDDLDIDENKKDKDNDNEVQHKEVVDLVQEILSEKVSAISISKRLTSTPAIVVDHESAAFRRMMKLVDQNNNNDHVLPKQKLEINPNHQIFKNLLAIHKKDANLAQLVVEQVFDNALIAADILDSPRSMLSRINTLLSNIGE